MGQRGPVPKRSDQRRRTNKPENPITKAPGAAPFTPARPPSEWHPAAKRWYESLALSGQSAFYEPSDWATAEIIAESISRDLKPQVVGVTRGRGPVRSDPAEGRQPRRLPQGDVGSLLVTEGDRRRVSLELERRAVAGGQLRFLLWWYAVDDRRRWLFHHGARRLAKGSGKSPFAAVLALIEFCAPVRLADFDLGCRAGAWASRSSMPLVQIAATAESQTANTMRMVRAFAPKGSRVVRGARPRPRQDPVLQAPGGDARGHHVVASTAAEGAEAFVHRRRTRRSTGSRRTAARAVARPCRTTWRSPGRGCWRPATPGCRASSRSPSRPGTPGWRRKRAAPAASPADPVRRPDRAARTPTWPTRQSLQAALEFVYDDCWWQKIRPIMERIWDPNVPARRFEAEVPELADRGADAWTTPEEWALLADATGRRRRRGGRAVLRRLEVRDATALIGCCVSDGHVFTVGVWEPNRAQHRRRRPGRGRRPRGRLAFETYNVVAFFGDVQEWESFVEDRLAGPPRRRLPIMAVPNGKDPQPIAWDMRGHVLRLHPGHRARRGRDPRRAFTHDDDPRLARHVANMRRRPNRWGVTRRQGSRRRRPARSTPAVCMIGARMVRRLALPRARRRSAPAGRLVKGGRRMCADTERSFDSSSDAVAAAQARTGAARPDRQVAALGPRQAARRGQSTRVQGARRAVAGPVGSPRRDRGRQTSCTSTATGERRPGRCAAVGVLAGERHGRPADRDARARAAYGLAYASVLPGESFTWANGCR
jgi:hypothetical protein